MLSSNRFLPVLVAAILLGDTPVAEALRLHGGGMLDGECPESLRVSKPMTSAPDPSLLGYRNVVNTHSATDGEAYTQFALKAATDDEAFKTFRQVYYDRYFAGIEGDKHVKLNSQYMVDASLENLQLMGRSKESIEHSLELVAELDAMGGGPRFPLTHNGKTYNVSGTLMRYLPRVADIEQLFGHSLEGMHLVEIGIGFGGFASVINRLHPEIGSYTLVDLPEVLNIAQKYANEANVDMSKMRFLNAAPCDPAGFKFEPESKYDLAISMFAYAELPQEVRKAYFNTILKSSPRGIVNDNMDYQIKSAHDLLPTMLTEEFGADSPKAASILVFPDVSMESPPQIKNREALVTWGSGNNYFESFVQDKLHNGLSEVWAYPYQKFNLAAPMEMPRELKKQTSHH